VSYSDGGGGEGVLDDGGLEQGECSGKERVLILTGRNQREQRTGRGSQRVEPRMTLRSERFITESGKSVKRNEVTLIRFGEARFGELDISALWDKPT
jgi:hypothetical protein